MWNLLGILFIVLPVRAAAAVYTVLFAVVGYIGIRWHRRELAVIDHCGSAAGRMEQFANGADNAACGLAVFWNVAAWVLMIGGFVLSAAFLIGLIFLLRHPSGSKRLLGFLDDETL